MLELINNSSNSEPTNFPKSNPFDNISVGNRKENVNDFDTTHTINIKTITKTNHTDDSNKDHIKPQETNTQDLPWYPNFIGSPTTTTSTRKITSEESSTISTSSSLPKTRIETTPDRHNKSLSASNDIDDSLKIMPSNTNDITTGSRSEPRNVPDGTTKTYSRINSTATLLPSLSTTNDNATPEALTPSIFLTTKPSTAFVTESSLSNNYNEITTFKNIASPIPLESDKISTLEFIESTTIFESLITIEYESSQMSTGSELDMSEFNANRPNNQVKLDKELSPNKSSSLPLMTIEDTSPSIAIVQEPTLPSTSTISTSLSTNHSTLYPYVKDHLESTTSHEIEGFALHEYPKYYNKAQAFTVYGESCYDLCEKRGYSYTWCHKFEESSNGYWSKADMCTNDATRTPYRENCINDCAKRGSDYFWCHTGTITWDYCTPESLLNYLDKRRNLI